jgi:hypothetical protein
LMSARCPCCLRHIRQFVQRLAVPGVVNALGEMTRLVRLQGWQLGDGGA